MINSDYIIFHLFEILYHVLDKFSSWFNLKIFIIGFIYVTGHYIQFLLKHLISNICL